jgi:DNA-binding NarL/FixJ family response regulator
MENEQIERHALVAYPWGVRAGSEASRGGEDERWSPETSTVAVVGPKDLLRQRILDVLRDDGLRVPACAERVDDLRDVAPAIVVIAAGRRLRDDDGMLRRVERDLAGSRVVLVARRDSRLRVRAILEAGAHGLVFDDELEWVLAPTVRAVAAGQTVVPYECRRDIDRPQLSARERQVLALVVEGLPNREVARRLFLSEATVKSHLSVIFRKLGVRSRTEAAALVLDGPGGRLDVDGERTGPGRERARMLRVGLA